MSTYTPGSNPKSVQSPERERREIDDGKYACQITQVEKTYAKTGTPRLSFSFRIEAGEFKGRSLFDDAYLQGRGTWKIELICEVTGVTQAFDVDDPLSLADTFTGKYLWVTWKRDRKKWTDKQGRQREGGKKVTTYGTLDPELRERLRAAA